MADMTIEEIAAEVERLKKELYRYQVQKGLIRCDHEWEEVLYGGEQCVKCDLYDSGLY